MLELNDELRSEAKIRMQIDEKMQWIVGVNFRGKDLQVVRDIKSPTVNAGAA